jgi:hypothetical protein
MSYKYRLRQIGYELQISVKNAVFWNVSPCGSRKNHASEKRIASSIRGTKTGEVGTTLAVTSNRSTLRSNTVRRVALQWETRWKVEGGRYLQLLLRRKGWVHSSLVFGPQRVEASNVLMSSLPIKENYVTSDLEPHCATSQITAFFIVTTTKTSNRK